MAWVFFAGGSGEPSTELTTPPIAADPTTTALTEPDPTTTAPTTSEPTTTEPSETESSEAEPTTTEATTDTGGAVSFVIDPGQSVASFEINEELRGSPNRVVGTTSEVAGQVQVDLADLSTARFSQIVINARTFTTDSSFRDRAIRGPVILNSAEDEYELITFDVSSIDLSGAAELSTPLEFSVSGDLLIRDVMQPTTFDVSVTLNDESTITGTAETTVLRDDFGIGIPSVPSVANVADEVLIRLDFVAIAG